MIKQAFLTFQWRFSYRNLNLITFKNVNLPFQQTQQQFKTGIVFYSHGITIVPTVFPQKIQVTGIVKGSVTIK